MRSSSLKSSRWLRALLYLFCTDTLEAPRSATPAQDAKRNGRCIFASATVRFPGHSLLSRTPFGGTVTGNFVKRVTKVESHTRLPRNGADGVGLTRFGTTHRVVRRMTAVFGAKRATIESTPTPSMHGIKWTEMGDGVWIAKRGGNFAGLVEELWGAGYRVSDRNGEIVGEFATFESARRQLV